jgi:hypothetical protein
MAGARLAPDSSYVGGTPHLAFGIAAYGFVEGSKTAPDPVVSAGSAV